MRRKELSMWGLKANLRGIYTILENEHQALHTHMKWSPSFNFSSPHFRGDCHQVGDEMHVSLPGTAPFTLLSPCLLCFTPVFVLFLLLLLFMSPFWGRGLGKDKVLAFPLWPGIQVSSPPQWTGSREQRDPSNQGLKRSRQGGEC